MGNRRPAVAVTGTVEPSGCDGRTLRRLRNRTAIIEAWLELVGNGELTVANTRIAACAGVSVRSIGYHFKDRSALVGAATWHVMSRLQTLLRPIDADLPLDERIELFSSQRGGVLEAIAPIERARVLREAMGERVPASTELDAMLRAQIASTFALELEASPQGTTKALETLDLIGSWPVWGQMRTQRQLSPEEARAVLTRLFQVALTQGGLTVRLPP